jgi:excinuclease ABC subunit A
LPVHQRAVLLVNWFYQPTGPPADWLTRIFTTLIREVESFLGNELIIRGAREHNLKNITLHLPRQKFIVFTGLSGSGKSSLAFDTIYAEGHRRYVESLSTYARQFLERVDKPDVDSIEGISPAIAIEQTNPVKHSRSTVGTATELYDYLRLLYAKIGQTICPDCQQLVAPDSVEKIIDRLFASHNGARVYINFPLPITPKTTSENLIGNLLAEGFIRLKIGEQLYTLEPKLILPLQGVQEVQVVVDRLVISPQEKRRLADSLETAFRQGGGVAYVELLGHGMLRFSQDFCCSTCQRSFEKPSPLFFSFNSPYGACPECRGFGNILDYDLSLIIPDRTKSLAAGAIEPWTLPRYRQHYAEELQKLAVQEGIDLHKPFQDLPDHAVQKILHGTKKFIGVLPFFHRLKEKKYKLYIRVFLSKYMSTVDCSQCQGSRLRQDALWVKIQGHSITDISRMTVAAARAFFDQLTLTPFAQEIAKDILKQIYSRLHFLHYVGLDYLTLDRLTRTLSGGEAQRINLANQLGAQLADTLYILDEPTVGLHPRDNHRLLDILKELSNRGNTVLVVEHDREVIAAADYIVDLGPLAGEKGGEVIFQGTLDGLVSHPWSLTARYLRGEKQVGTPRKPRAPEGYLCLYGAAENNLKEIDVRIPLGTFTCVTGVSGSGKSTLIHDTLYYALDRIFHGSTHKIGKFEKISGFESLRDVILLDQKPIGKSPRSNPVTYIKAFDPIRQLFANTAIARVRGYTAGHFSFNVSGGRCEACKGDGYHKIEMHFMADIYVRCDQCHGTRFKRELLEVKYRGVDIHQVLQMTVEEAKAFFSHVPLAVQKLNLLVEVGLGYLRLGQPAPTLSGGEAQRLKIAAELSKKNPYAILYILDEPTTGLHFDDVHKLLMVLNRLVDQGNTVVVIEHNLDVIQAADHIIDLGPEGGDAGGYIVAEGSPQKIMQSPTSYTGQYLMKR